MKNEKYALLHKTMLQILELKQIKRQGWINSNIPYEQVESVADHSYCTALFAQIIARECYPELDLEKVLQYALIHDLGEIFAGDITPEDGVSATLKSKKELNAVRKIFADLPNGEFYIELWQDFEAATNKEAKFVKQLDKLEMALQARYYENKSGKDLQNFISSAKNIMEDMELKHLLEVF